MRIQVGTQVQANREASAISVSIRCLAVLSGCLALVWFFFIPASPFLILGALVQPKAKTTGRWLVWVGAFLLSLLVPYSAMSLGLSPWFRFDLVRVLFQLLLVLAIVLDCALIRDVWTSRRGQWVRSSWDWVAWILAVLLTGWYGFGLWNSLPELATWGFRLDNFVFRLTVVSVILAFDAALVTLALKRRTL
jgi:hypothetical protein